MTSDSRILLEDLPLQTLVMVELDVVFGSLPRVGKDFERLVDQPEMLFVPRGQVVRMIALGEQAVYAFDRLGVRVLAELQYFVVVDERLIIHESPQRLRLASWDGSRRRGRATTRPRQFGRRIGGKTGATGPGRGCQGARRDASSALFCN